MGRNFFVKRKTFVKLFHHIYYLANYLINLFFGLLQRHENQIAQFFFLFFFAVPTIVEAAMEALPLLVIYFFN